MAGSAAAATRGPGRAPASPTPQQRCVGVIDELRPDVVVTYDATGGYGHPDHVRTHEATCHAVATAAEAPVLYAVLTPLSWAVEDRAWLAEHVPADPGWVVPGEGDPFPSQVVPDEVVTHTVVDPAVVAGAVAGAALPRDAGRGG